MKYFILFLSLLAFFLFILQKEEGNQKTKEKQLPKSYASTNLAADEILIDLHREESDYKKILALSSLADNKSYSFIPKEIRDKIPLRSNTNLEKLITLHPDMIFTASFNRLSLVQTFKKSGIEVINLENFNSLSNLYENYRLIGKKIGKSKEANKIVKQIEIKLKVFAKASQAQRKPKVLIILEDGTGIGKETLLHDIVETCGGENILASKGLSGWNKIPREKLATYQVDWLITSLTHTEKQERQNFFLSHPVLKQFKAVKEGRIINLSSREMSTQSSFITRTAKHVCQRIQENSST